MELRVLKVSHTHVHTHAQEIQNKVADTEVIRANKRERVQYKCVNIIKRQRFSYLFKKKIPWYIVYKKNKTTGRRK